MDGIKYLVDVVKADDATSTRAPARTQTHIKHVIRSKLTLYVVDICTYVRLLILMIKMSNLFYYLKYRRTFNCFKNMQLVCGKSVVDDSIRIAYQFFECTCVVCWYWGYSVPNVIQTDMFIVTFLFNNMQLWCCEFVWNWCGRSNQTKNVHNATSGLSPKDLSSLLGDFPMTTRAHIHAQINTGTINSESTFIKQLIKIVPCV